MPTNSDWKTQTKRYVAFLDILGFKDYVQRHSVGIVYNRLRTLNGLLPTEDEQDLDSEMEKRIKCTIFSDSIFIFSKDDTIASFNHFLIYVRRIMRMALRKRIPLKGAIAFGHIVVDEKTNLFCGQPIIDAYLLEEDLQYMGVVFHHTFEEEYGRFSETQSKRTSESIKDRPTPFKYGLRHHWNLDYRVSDSRIYDLKKYVEKQRCYSSGDARKYVDNTLTMLESFEKE